LTTARMTRKCVITGSLDHWERETRQGARTLHPAVSAKGTNSPHSHWHGVELHPPHETWQEESNANPSVAKGTRSTSGTMPYPRRRHPRRAGRRGVNARQHGTWAATREAASSCCVLLGVEAKAHSGYGVVTDHIHLFILFLFCLCTVVLCCV
jgi:hypothetical protein